MKIFRRFRESAITKKDISKYILYAIGEIILVVIGILIAVNVNARNTQAQQQKRVDLIALEVVKQIKLDTTEITSVFKTWDYQESLMDSLLVLNLSKDELRACQSCKFLIEGNIVPTLDNTVIQHINSVPTPEHRYSNAFVDIRKDYNELLSMYETYNEASNTAITEYMLMLRDTKDWFSDYVNIGKCNEDCETYFLSPDYKNRVSYLQLLMFDAYYGELLISNSKMDKHIRVLDSIIKT